MMNSDGFIQIDQELCTGCRHCSDNCAVQAISGEPKKPQSVSSGRCVVCGQCVQICSAFDYAEKITGIPEQQIRETMRTYAAAESGFILYGMGVTHYGQAVDVVRGFPAWRC